MIANSLENAIRLKDQKVASGAILVELKKIISAYGARAAVTQEAILETVELIISRFGMLEINEIREAYRAFSTGEITAQGGEMYGGQFNVNQIGRILSAWVEHRRAIYADYLKEIELHEIQAKEEKEKEERQRNFDQQFDDYLQQIADGCRTFHDVPEFLYQSCKNRGMINFYPGEAHEIHRRAFVIAGNEIQQEIKDNRLKGIKTVFKSPDVDKRAKVYARKLTVFEKILNHANSESPNYSNA